VLRRYIEHMPVPTTGIHHDQVLYWYQMHQDRAAKPGEKAVIERIWPKPVMVRITSDDIKRKMLDDAENPFKKYYVVDVDVTESQGALSYTKFLMSKTRLIGTRRLHNRRGMDTYLHFSGEDRLADDLRDLRGDSVSDRVISVHPIGKPISASVK